MKNRKLIITLTTGLILMVALFWLIFKGCSSDFGYNGSVHYVGVDSSWYPIDLRGKEKNMVGFASVLLQKIGLEQGFRVNVFEVGANALFDGLEIKKYIGILSTLTPSVLNDRKYEFSDPIYRVGPVLILPINSKFTSLDQMDGKILAIENGILQTSDINEPHSSVIIPYDTASQTLESLDKGVTDGAILDALRAYVYTDGFYKGKLKVATSPLTDKGIRIVTLKDKHGLHFVQQIDEGLKKLKEDGTYDRLIKDWDLTNTEVSLPK